MKVAWRCAPAVSGDSTGFGVIGYLGPNGSGKSTTVKMLVGLMPPCLAPIAGGLLIGAFVGAVGRWILASVLSLPMSAVDPIEFLTVAVLLVTAGAVACYWPARRAAQVDPTVALRTS